MKKIRAEASIAIISFLATIVIYCAWEIFIASAVRIILKPNYNRLANGSEAKIDAGSISGNTFTNDYFNVKIKLPDDFHICSDEETAQAIKVGVEMAVADKDNFDYSTQYSIPFFDVIEENIFDPKIMATKTGVTMKISAQAGIIIPVISLAVKNETDFLNYYTAQIQEVLAEGLSYTFGDIESVDISGKTFYKVDATAYYYGIFIIDQILYCYKQGDYILSITVGYDQNNNNHVETLNEFLANIKFS